MWVEFNEEARAALQQVQADAGTDRVTAIGTGRVLEGILAEETAATKLLTAFGIEPELVRLALQPQLRQESRELSHESGDKAQEARTVASTRLAFELAADETERLGLRYIGTEHLLLGILRARHHVTLTNAYYFVFILRKLKFFNDAELRAASDKMHWRAGDWASVVLQDFGLELSAARLFLRDARPVEDLNITAEVSRIIQRAHELTHETGCGRIAPAHLWLALLKEPHSLACKTLESTGMALGELESALRKGIRSDYKVRENRPRFTAEARRVMTNARSEATTAAYRFIGSEQLLLALMGAIETRLETAGQRLRLSAPCDDTIATALRASGLWDQGHDVESVRRKIVDELRGPRPRKRNVKSAVPVTRGHYVCFILPAVFIVPAILILITTAPQLASRDFWVAVAAGMIVIPMIGCLVVAGLLLFSRSKRAKSLGMAFLGGFLFAMLCAFGLMKLDGG